MDIEYIEVENFKGIKNLKIDFSKSPRSRFYTLVGLNESGKTTILEAINNFCYGPERMEGLQLDEVGEVAPKNMISISQRSNWNGTIEIIIKVSFTRLDKVRLRKQLRKEHPDLKSITLSDSTKVTYSLSFKNSILDTSSRYWDIDISGCKGNQRKERSYGSDSDMWQDAVKILSKGFPDIIYFPNFLFDFPDRIYLDSDGNQKDEFYRRLLQDILDSLGTDCSLETHILDRIKNKEGESQRNLRAVLLEVERELTKTVFASWNSIFGGDANDKRVHVVCGEETSNTDPKAGRYYIELQLEDANGQCSISERSLGFRWFFVFRLLTYYRGHRNSRGGSKKVLFLLDEPASNLHPTAQSALINCLEDLPKECYLIYTTHSHHLINPKWLENTYVVKNEGMDYVRPAPAYDYSARQTCITATPYRAFVGQYPDQTCYFKPILDVLDYAPSELEFTKAGVLVEGKNDFYVLNYMKDCLKDEELSFNLIPSCGAGKLDPLIQLYSGWGKSFCVLLDSDSAGEDGKKKYESQWECLVEGKIFTYTDILDDFSGKAPESMFTDEDREKIYSKVGEPQNKNKKAFNRALQELWAKKEFIDFDKTTKVQFKKIFDFLNNFFIEE